MKNIKQRTQDILSNVVNEINRGKKVTLSKIGKQFKMTKEGVRYHIQKLIKRKLLKREAKTKNLIINKVK